MIQLRNVRLKTDQILSALKTHFGYEFSCRIIAELLDVNPKTYKQDLEIAQDAFRQGLIINANQSPRFNYLAMVRQVNSKLFDGRNIEDHMRFCYRLFDVNNDGVVCIQDLYRCYEMVVCENQ